MYYIIRCDCGRVLYAKKGVATRKCTCGKTLKVKSRVQQMQEKIYGESVFSTAAEMKDNKFLNQIDRKMKKL